MTPTLPPSPLTDRIRGWAPWSFEAMERIAFLNVHVTDDSELPTTEDLLHFAATGDHTWEASSAVVYTSPGSAMASVIINAMASRLATDRGAL